MFIMSERRRTELFIFRSAGISILAIRISRKKEDGRRKKEEGRRKKEKGRRSTKCEVRRRKKEDRRTKNEERTGRTRL